MIFKIENYLALREATDRLCAFLLAEKVDEERAFDCKLIVYELIGNVLKHADGGATLYGEVSDGLVRLKLVAAKPFCPPNTTACADVFAEQGRGLFLVEKLCEEQTFTSEGEWIITIKSK
ncbi:MAG: ATP-binding protein [Clostridia bacterium]|nr:ATP-binding protein [Clostridia bacterium]